MASITQLGKRFRACVRTKMHGNQSQMFDTYDEAMAWAHQVESAVPALTDEEEIMKIYARQFAVPVVRVVGVYFLMRDGEVVYVGQSVNFHRRLHNHLEEGKKFDAYYLMECDKADLTRVERRWIDALRPEYNMDATTKRKRTTAGSGTKPAAGVDTPGVSGAFPGHHDSDT